MYDHLKIKSKLIVSLKTQLGIVYALMLRNLRTRFFGHGFGYLISLLWPLAHILILIIIYTYMGRVVPYGESAILFFATGTIPFMIFSYLSRFMMLSVILSKPLLAFPKVKVIDVLLSSAILEVLSSFTVIIILVIIGIILDINFWPRNIVETFCAMGASVTIGVGFGILNGVIAMAFPFWAVIYILITILLWVTSGVVFVASNLPENVKEFAVYHPTLLIVEWVRSSYYDGYGDQLLDRVYVIKFGLTLIFGGFLLERLMRGYLMTAK